MSSAQAYQYRDLQSSTGTLVNWLIIGAGVSAIVAIAQLAIGTRRLNNEPHLGGIAMGVTFIIAMGVTFIITIWLFARWILQAQRNVRALGATGLPISPGWAVGSYFMPIWHLWDPYRAMVALWQASHKPASWQSVPVPDLLRWWWAVWVIPFAMMYFPSLGLVFLGPEAGSSIGRWVEHLYDVITPAQRVIVCLLAIQVVQGIQRAQALAYSEQQTAMRDESL